MDYKEIKRLSDDYFEGRTTLEEEQLLREYFNSNKEIPEELESVKLMFGFHEKEAKQKMTKAFNSKPISMRKPKRYYYMGIAASIACLVGVLYFNQTSKEEPIYAYIDGIPIKDKRRAISETKKVLFVLSNKFNHGTRSFNHLAKFNQTRQTISQKTK